MNAFLALTDYHWFTFLASLPKLEEVNFWQPGGGSVFKAIKPSELLLFKLHRPRNFVVGGGLFTHASILPISLAWDAFGQANGAATFEAMRDQIEQYRNRKQKAVDSVSDYTIGCLLLSQPFFLPEDQWMPVPSDWSPNIVRGKTYDLTTGHGLALYRRLQERLALPSPEPLMKTVAETPAERYGAPVEILPRLGQGSFRVIITDAYERRCAVSGERVLPVLDAAHIRPYVKEGSNRPDNGILLRSDLHTLFDRDYATVTSDHRFEVSRRIKEDFDNGQEYYALHGREIFVPKKIIHRPAGENLEWHNENVYKG